MPDTIGRITVPTVINSGQTFPLTTQYPFGFSVERPVIAHRFGSLDAKQEQRYYVGIGPRKFQFKHQNLNWAETNQLKAFWEGMQGPWKAFTYTVPNPGGSTTDVLVTFEQTPISFEYLRNAAQVGLNLIEVVDPTQAPTYAVNSTCLRFPSNALSTALLSEVQQIIPLVHIRVRESAVADIYVSDRRVTVGGQLYLPRLIGIGEPGSDVLISQDIKGTSDNVRFTFGNGDRVMTQLANDTDLKYAEIDLCLFHVNSGILLQLWKGVIQNFTSDGTPIFPVTCSDGFFQIMNQYPERQASRQCWKTYDDGVNCPWATRGASATAVTAAGGAPASCDSYLESANGCQVHGMAPYFGGQQADPQGVVIKDDSTGFLGFGRNTVTATSIVTETIWGLALPEIWCNSGGNPLYAFMASALMIAYRDESGYADSLGIVGAGPLGGFTASMVVTNADGYRYVVAPMVDGYLWQGLKLDGNLNVTKYQPGMGLRYVTGSDPANSSTDYFSLGQGSPQVWEPNVYAAGTAAWKIRPVKSTTIQRSTPDQHQITVPIDYGMWGWAWDQNGNRTATRGLINPFWIAVNMLLRAMGLYGDPSTGSNPAGGSGPTTFAQLATFVLPSLIVGDGSGAAEIAADQVAAILGTGVEIAVPVPGNRQQPEAVSRLAHRGAQLLPGILHLGVREAEARMPRQRQRGGRVHPRQPAASNPAAHAYSSSLRALGTVVRRRRLSISGEHGGVLRQEPRGVLRARRISAHQPDALGGVLVAKPGVADRSHSDARGDRRRKPRRVARRAQRRVADHPARSWQRGRASGLDDASGHPRTSWDMQRHRHLGHMGQRRCLRRVHGEQGSRDQRRAGVDHGLHDGPDLPHGNRLAPGFGAGQRNQSSVPNCDDVLQDSAMEPEEGLVGADRGPDRHRFHVRSGRRPEADGRRARTPAASVLFDSARASVGTIPGGGSGE